MKIYKILCLLLLIMYNCKNPKPQISQGEYVKYTGTNTNSLFDLIDSIRIVKLQDNDTIIIGGQPEFCHRDSSFYLIDKYGTKLIYRFGKDGTFYNSIGIIGRAPGEYSNLNDVYIDDIKNEITVLSNSTSIYEYSKDGLFKSQKKNNIDIYRFCKVNNSYWLYLGYNSPYSKYRILHVDNNMELLSEFLPLKTKIIPVDGYPIFSIYKDQVFIHEDFNKSIYQITNDSLKELFHFDFGSYNVTDNYFKERNPFKAFQNLQNKGFANIRSFYQSDYYYFIDLVFQKGKESKLVYGFKCINNDEWNWIEYTDPNTLSLFAGNIKGFTKEGLLVCFCFGTNLPQFSNLEKEKIINQELLTNSNKDLNMYLFLCYLKK